MKKVRVALELRLLDFWPLNIKLYCELDWRKGKGAYLYACGSGRANGSLW